uniref:CWF19-like protein 1 n=1 Tax=Hirondellea gigas TaxID=1518452 RepID=A0A2P2I4V1_9CRUS
MSKFQKVLVCGDVNGQFDELFKRVSSVHQKAGPFDLLLCVGDFFAEGANSQWTPYKTARIKVPLPTYVLGPSKEGHKQHYSDLRGCELSENVIYLGPSGIYPSSSGLRIAYLSGRQDTPAGLAGYTNKKVEELEVEGKQQGIIDILLTSQWPSLVTSYASKPAEGCDVEAAGCGLVARLAHSLKPRYHFTAGLNTYYQRLPYRNHQILQEAPQHVTRFLSLSAVGNSDKKSKWLYAFTITPAVHCSTAELVVQPSDVTEGPYAVHKLPPLEQEGSGINQFFYGGAEKKGHRGKKRSAESQDNNREKRLPPKPTGPCWFCLSSPEVEKHLVVSVGEHIYLALAKGGLVPHHLMLLPIHHYQTSLDLEKQAHAELNKFKSRLREMFAESGRAVVFYERNYRTTHMQLHAVPLTQNKATRVAQVFTEAGEEHGLPLEELPRHTELSAAVQSGQPFLMVEPPQGPTLLHRVKKGYNMRFDREVLASKDLLNLPERVDWKDCMSSRQEETENRDNIRKIFKPFDFTIDSDDGPDDDSSDDS